MLCTGKLSYELIEARDKAGDRNTSIVRVEQLYPFPGEALLARLARMTNLEEVVWAQEEPQNQGYWAHVEPRIERRLGEAGPKPKRPVYAGRAPAASPATGLAKRHAAEQAALIADALGRPAGLLFTNIDDPTDDELAEATQPEPWETMPVLDEETLERLRRLLFPQHARAGTHGTA